MTIKKAIEHLAWKFKNSWKPTPKDIEAFNEVAEFTETQLTKQYNDNQLFAKLYITLYGELLKYYNSTVFDKEPQKAIHQILDTPIETLIKKFVDKADLIEQTKEWFDQAGNTHPRLSDTSSINPEAISMTYDEAVENLTTMMNMALTKYK